MPEDYVQPERYTLTWPGKRAAFELLQTPAGAALRPCRAGSLDWDRTRHVFIEGDNLDALKLLQTAYAGRVKLIYIDPPYNTGKDLIYPDRYAEGLGAYLQLTGQIDQAGNPTTASPETGGRYHAAWLSMIYPRLILARRLLRDDGVIFISIDDTELANLLLVMNEIFGEENHETIITWRRRHNQPNDKTKMIARVAEYIVVYARNSEALKAAHTFYGLPLSGRRQRQYTNPDGDPRGPWSSKPWKAGSGQSGSRYHLTTPTGVGYDEVWLGSEETYAALLREGRIYFPRGGDGLPRKKYYLGERLREGQSAHNFWDHRQFGSNQEATAELGALMGQKQLFDNPKPVRLVKAIARLCTSRDDIVLDFFAGSCTTAQAVLELNQEDGASRRFIMVQLPEPTGDTRYPTIADIGLERLRRAAAALGRRPSPAIAQDLGFRLFRLDSEKPDPLDSEGTRRGTRRGTRSRFSETCQVSDPEATLFHLALQEGIGLDSRIESLPGLPANSVYRVTSADMAQSILVCLDDHLDAQTARDLPLDRHLTLICREQALDTTVAANLAQRCRFRAI